MNYEQLKKRFEAAEAAYHKEKTAETLAKFDEHALKLIRLHEVEIRNAQVKHAEALEQKNKGGQKKALEDEELARERLADVRGRRLGGKMFHGIKGESFDLPLSRKTSKKPKPEKIDAGWRGYIPRIRRGKTRLG